MTTKAGVKDFLAQRRLAVVGVSRGGKKFGNTAFKELKSKCLPSQPLFIIGCTAGYGG